MWVTAYYTTWGVCELPPQDIDYTGVTHIIHQSLDPDASRPGRYWAFPFARQEDDTLYFEQGVGTGCAASPVQANLITFAHQNGVKVVLGLGGIFDGQFEIITADSNVLRTYVHSVLSYAKSRGYDGVDIDWEFVWSGSRQGFIALLRTLRDTLNTWNPRGLLTIAVPGWYNSGYGYDYQAMNLYCDQVNLMNYDHAGSWNTYTGFNAPLYRPNYPNYDGAIIDERVREVFQTGGLDTSKAALGLAFYTTSWFTNSAPGQLRTGGVFQGNYRGVVASKNATTFHYDYTAKVPWLGSSGLGAFISYEDESSLSEKVRYAKALGLGGVMIFELWRGLVPTNPAGQRQPLMTAVKNAVAGIYVPPPPPPAPDSIAPTVGFTSPANGASISGTIDLVASATDNIGVEGVQFKVDGTDYRSVIQNPPYRVPLNTWRLSNGQHSLAVVAWDGSSNQQTSQITVTVNNQGPPPVLPDIIVYDDALRPPFRNASWSAYVDFNHTGIVKSGTKSVKVDYLAWGGFDLMNGTWGSLVDIDPVDYDTLYFDVYPTDVLDIHVGFYADGGTVLSYAVDVTPVPHQWTSYAIPLSFPEMFDKFYFQSSADTGLTCYFDNILIHSRTAVALPPPAGTPTVPKDYSLSQNFPNPFNPLTRIEYALPVPANVTLKIYNLWGQEVVTLVGGSHAAGSFQAIWDGRNAFGELVGTGIYFYRLQAGDFVETKKLTLLH
jgi:chitinase